MAFHSGIIDYSHATIPITNHFDVKPFLLHTNMPVSSQEPSNCLSLFLFFFFSKKFELMTDPDKLLEFFCN